MSAYYNENNEEAVAALKGMMRDGFIAEGEIDARSIVDVRPDDLRGFTQCHFFAGIGIWSYALRHLAEWPDDRPVWTGSCPCQPFSSAGKGAGFDDERHLWPAWFWLIEHGKREDVPIFGEQVASSDGLAWLDLVLSDLEGTGYACWPFDLCAAGFGAPHIRQRLYFVANSQKFGHDRGIAGNEKSEASTPPRGRDEGVLRIPHSADGGCHGIMEHPIQPGLEGHTGHGGNGSEPGRDGARPAGPITEASKSVGMGNAAGPRLFPGAQRGICGGEAEAGTRDAKFERPSEAVQPGPVNGFWRSTDWLYCRDDKWRAVEPGTSPLATGTSARAGRLRCYGNSIVAPQAAAFIKIVNEVLTEK